MALKCKKCGLLQEDETFNWHWDEVQECEVPIYPCKRCRRNSWVKRKYGITLLDAWKLLEKQKFQCRICKTRISIIEKGSIDRCYETGTIRGILCNLCNSGLGMFKDDLIRLESAVLYIRETNQNTKKGT